MNVNYFTLAAQNDKAMNPAVSVIYVNYNTSDLLLQSVKSLTEQCRIVPFEIIIIDNASRPEDRQQLQNGLDELNNGNIYVIFSPTNAGFSKANNLGARESKGRYLLFLNPDTLVMNDVLTIFYNFLEWSAQNIAACGGNLLKDDLSPNYSYGNFPGMLYEICSIGFGLRYLFNDYYKESIFIGKTVEGNEVREAPYITGADIFIRADLFRSMNGFDENFFMYYEETDLFLRLARQGYRSFILPEAKIIHFEGGSVAQSSELTFNYRKFEMTLKSKLYYFSKWYSQPTVGFLKVVVLLQILVQYLKGSQGKSLKRSLSIYRQSI